MISFECYTVSLLIFVILFLTIYNLYFTAASVHDPNGWIYRFYCLFVAFLLHNIFGNMFLCWRTDNSMRSLPHSRRQPPPSDAHLWHFCKQCDSMVPPRSWHCQVCERCTLKRDHHCMFTASCIGHNNQRYFICLMAYFSVATAVCLAYSIAEAWYSHSLLITDPFWVHLIFWGYNIQIDPSQYSWQMFTSLIAKLTLIAFILPTWLFVAQMVMVKRNSTSYNMEDRSYYIGFWPNVELVFGKRRFWTLLSPFVNSPLPHDGIQWNMQKKSY